MTRLVISKGTFGDGKLIEEKKMMMETNEQ